MVERPEYLRMVDELPALMAQFDATICAGELADLAVLMSAMEEVDGTLDPIRDPLARRAFADEVVRRLSLGEEPTDAGPVGDITARSTTCDALVELPARARRSIEPDRRELAGRRSAGRDGPDGLEAERGVEPGRAIASSGPAVIGHQRGRARASIERADAPESPDPLRALDALAALARRRRIDLAPLVRDTLANAERMRTTRDPADYIACVELEGLLCVELALQFCAPPVAFVKFLRAVGPPANLFDKLVDLHLDVAEGTLAIPPSKLRARLAARIAAWGPRVVASHPDIVALARWSMRWLGAMQPSPPRPGRRIAVVGTSGSGKTFVARALADKLGLTYISNDAIIWRERWRPTPPRDRVTAIDAATRAAGWTFDGNLHDAPEDRNVLDRADTIVWIDLPRPTVLAQITRRTLRRVITRERLWHGNIESWRGAPAMIRWSMRTFSRRRAVYTQMLAGTDWPSIRVWLRSRADVDEWLASI